MSSARKLLAIRIATVVSVALTAPCHATVMTLVSGNTTPGHYNSSVGDLGAPNGTPPWFPPPNTFSGTQDLIFVSEPDLSGASVSLGNWLGDPGNLNGNWTGPQAIPGNWAVNAEVAIVYAFDAGPGLQGITASFGSVDNGIHLWVDGNWKFGARDPEGRAWSNIALGDVGPGQHYIQILLEDSGGATAYVNPTISGNVVPVPAAAWLFGSGMLGLIAFARRRKLD